MPAPTTLTLLRRAKIAFDGREVAAGVVRVGVGVAADASAGGSGGCGVLVSYTSQGSRPW
jgi:hypothetical protein